MDKYKLTTTSKSQEQTQIRECVIKRDVNRIKLPGIHIDGRLNLYYQVSQLYKRVNKKIHAMTRICKYMGQEKEKKEKRKTFMTAFVKYPFSR